MFVGLDADWRKDEGALRRVGFVMKDGRVWKAVGMIQGGLVGECEGRR